MRLGNAIADLLEAPVSAGVPVAAGGGVAVGIELVAAQLAQAVGGLHGPVEVVVVVLRGVPVGIDPRGQAPQAVIAQRGGVDGAGRRVCVLDADAAALKGSGV